MQIISIQKNYKSLYDYQEMYDLYTYLMHQHTWHKVSPYEKGP